MAYFQSSDDIWFFVLESTKDEHAKEELDYASIFGSTSNTTLWKRIFDRHGAESNILTHAAAVDNCGAFCWLLARGVRPDADTLAVALKKNRDIYFWRCAQSENMRGVSLTPQHMAIACRKGHREIVTYLMTLGCPVDESACAMAALGGHLDILCLLREKCAPWNCLTLMNARQAGHSHIVEWAKDQGCPRVALHEHDSLSTKMLIRRKWRGRRKE